MRLLCGAAAKALLVAELLDAVGPKRLAAAEPLVEEHTAVVAAAAAQEGLVVTKPAVALGHCAEDGQALVVTRLVVALGHFAEVGQVHVAAAAQVLRAVAEVVAPLEELDTAAVWGLVVRRLALAVVALVRPAVEPLRAVPKQISWVGPLV